MELFCLAGGKRESALLPALEVLVGKLCRPLGATVSEMSRSGISTSGSSLEMLTSSTQQRGWWMMEVVEMLRLPADLELDGEEGGIG